MVILAVAIFREDSKRLHASRGQNSVRMRPRGGRHPCPADMQYVGTMTPKNNILQGHRTNVARVLRCAA